MAGPGMPVAGPSTVNVVVGSGGLTPQQLRAQSVRVQAAVVQPYATEMYHLPVGSGIALAVMSVVSIALGWIGAGHVLGPLRTITISRRDISSTNPDARRALAGPDDELKELGTPSMACWPGRDASSRDDPPGPRCSEIRWIRSVDGGERLAGVAARG